MKINKIIKSYFPIADLIAKTFGSQCEVVIHDLTQPKNSIVYIVNSHVTNKEIGDPFNVLIKQVLLSKNFKNDVTANYKTVTKDGKLVKSSTAFIRNGKNDVIGAICINYNLDKIMDMGDLLIDFVKINDVNIEEIDYIENQMDNVLEIAEGMIEKIISSSQSKLSTKEEKLEILDFMEQKGIFLIKGSIEKVAERLKISKVTVYSYLDEIKRRLR